MPIQDRTQVGQPVTAAPVLPSQYPGAPAKLAKAFPGFEEYHAEQEALYKRIRESLTTSHQTLALPIETTQNQVKALDGYIKSLVKAGAIGGGWFAAVQTEQAARIDADGALGTRIDTVETTALGLSTAITSEATARANADGALGIRIDDVITTVNGVSASVTAESTARATADGFLSGNYTLRVGAGNVVTGMSITSSVAANGGTTSDIIFQASSFKIYDGSSAQAVFTASGGVVTINGSLIAPGTVGNSLFDTATINKLSQLGVTGSYSGTIAANQIVAASLTAISATLGTAVVGANGHLRQGQTGFDTGTGFWLGDVSGTPKFSLGNSAGNKLTWDGSTLSIVGSVTLTNSIPATNVTGLATVATTGSYASLSSTPNTTYINGSGIYTGTIQANQISASTLSAIQAYIGTLSVNNGGYLRSGQSAFDTGTGFWIGQSSLVHKVSIGNSAGNKLTWDGTTLTVVGSITITNTIPAASVSGLAAVATSGTLAAGSVTGLATVATSGSYANLSGTPNTTYIDGSGIYTGTLVASQITAATATLGSLSAVNAELGSVVISSSGALRSGQTAYDTGTGFWLGIAGGVPKLSIGNSAGNKLLWTGTALSVVATDLTLGRMAIKATSNPWDNSAVLTVSKVYAPTLTPVALGSYAYTGGSATYDRGQMTLEGYGNVLGLVNYVRLEVEPNTLSWKASSTYAGLDAASSVMLYAHSDQGLSVSHGGTETFRVSSTGAKATGLRIQSLTASSNVSRTTGSHKAVGGFVSPGTGVAYTFAIDLTNKGFSATPNWGFGQALAEETYSVVYRDDLSSSTSAVFRVTKRSGAAFALNEAVWYKVFVELID